MTIKTGGLRKVIIIGPIVIKLPLAKFYCKPSIFKIGRGHNKTERKCWRHYKDSKHLAPIFFADPFGLIVVMARAEHIEDDIPYNELENVMDFGSKNNIRDINRLNCGIYKGNTVIIDYGIWNLPLGKWE